MKKTTIGKATAAYTVMSREDFTLAKASSPTRMAAVRCACALAKVSEDFNRFVAEAAERLRPEGFAGIAAKMRGNEPLTEEERVAARRFDSELEACVRPEQEREIELPFAPLDAESLSEVLDSNPRLSVSEMILLAEVSGKEDGNAV